MSKANEEFQALLQRVLEGSDEAAHELFRDYAPYLVHVIRKRLHQRLRSQFDSQDFVQDVWASFFATGPRNRVFQSSDDLVAFLTRLARNKVIDAVRNRAQTQKRELSREQSLDDSTRFDKEMLVGDEPTPSQTIGTSEEWQAFFRKQPLVYRRVYVLMRAGRTQAEIAHELGLDPRMVSHVVKLLTPEAIS